MDVSASFFQWSPIDRLRRSVSVRLFAVIFAFSCVLTIVLAGVQLYREYLHGVELVQSKLSEVGRSYRDGLGEALWRLDQRQLQSELNDMLSLRDIRAVSVREAGAEPLVVSAGESPVQGSAIARDFSIVRRVRGSDRVIGTLHVVATLDRVLADVAGTAVLILVGQATNTFLIALFISWLLNRLVTRHLGAVAQAVGSYDYREPPLPLVLDRNARTAPDEFDRLVQAFNAMSTRAHRAYVEERQAAAEREARRAAEAANSAKSAFLASMSHELRTPLNGILGYAQILQRDGSLRVAQRDAVAVIMHCGEQLLALIRDVLDFAMIEAGRMRIEIGDVPVAETIGAVSEVIAIKAADKGLAFVTQIAPDAPTGVRADERRLRQVLANLLTNAVKFTAAGTVVMRVSRAASGGARFEVADTGIGIAEDCLERIFLPYEQARRPGGNDGGIGLGLAISRQFVRAMGTDIVAHSTVDKGSVFCFELPAAEAAGDARALRCERNATGYLGRRHTVLVVDDAEVNRAVIADWLSTLGFAVVKAATAEDALEQLARSDVSIVLSDVVMPGMSGLEFIRRLRELPEYVDIPIVALSASASESDLDKTFRAGANAFLLKPVEFGRLQAAIASLLGLKWIYAGEPDELPLTPERLSQLRLRVPPAQRMRDLHLLARMGDMRGVRRWAEEIASADMSYTAFASTLHALARTYQSKALLTFVERHLEEAPSA
ncbi:MAG: response regulator [Trinickia sp.]|uniref:hybrid sensor histidine kinase/response regulator n=1 Tax=Trinickia sp. TaxID=2571163 RepID=UPI003F7FADE3